MKTIAIDFDGVIHKYSLGWNDGSIYDIDVEGSFDAIYELMKNYSVFIFSTRDSKQIQEWLVKKQWFPSEIIPEDMQFWNKQGVIGITNRKLPAIAYIDDRSIRFTNWRDVLNYF